MAAVAIASATEAFTAPNFVTADGMITVAKGGVGSEGFAAVGIRSSLASGLVSHMSFGNSFAPPTTVTPTARSFVRRFSVVPFRNGAAT